MGRSELLWGAGFGFHASTYLPGTALESCDSGVWSYGVYTQMQRRSFASRDSQMVRPLTLDIQLYVVSVLTLIAVGGGVTSSSWEGGLARGRQPASSPNSAPSLLLQTLAC